MQLMQNKEGMLYMGDHVLYHQRDAWQKKFGNHWTMVFECCVND